MPDNPIISNQSDAVAQISRYIININQSTVDDHISSILKNKMLEQNKLLPYSIHDSITLMRPLTINKADLESLRPGAWTRRMMLMHEEDPVFLETFEEADRRRLRDLFRQMADSISVRDNLTDSFRGMVDPSSDDWTRYRPQGESISGRRRE